MIALDFSKQQTVGPDHKAIQLIYFTWNLRWDVNATMVFIIEEAKDTILDFSQGTLRLL